MSVSKQPKNRHLQMQGNSILSGSAGYGNRGDLLGVSLTRMVELEVTFVDTTGTAGRPQGAHKEAGKSVRIREATKRRYHAKVGTSVYTYATLAHETHGRLGDEAKEQIRILADEACCHSLVNRSTFIRNLKTELCVATVKRNAPVFQSCISQLGRTVLIFVFALHGPLVKKVVINKQNKPSKNAVQLRTPYLRPVCAPM